MFARIILGILILFFIVEGLGAYSGATAIFGQIYAGECWIIAAILLSADMITEAIKKRKKENN